MSYSGDVQLMEYEVTARREIEKGVFIAKVEINVCGKSLRLCEKEVGDVSCVLWDVALVLAKNLESRFNDTQD